MWSQQAADNMDHDYIKRIYLSQLKRAHMS